MADDPVVYAGQTLEFEWADNGSPANATLNFNVRGEGVFRRVVGRRAGGTWTGTVAATATASWPVGRYEYQTVLKASSKVSVVETGRFEVAAMAGDAGRHVEPSFAEKVLAKAEEVLLVASGSAEISFSVADQSYTFETRNDLLAFREQIRSEIARERTGVTASGYRW